MKVDIQTAELKHLSEIIELNKIVDYQNPDSFIEESIVGGKVMIALLDRRVAGFLLFQELWGNTIHLSLIKIHSDFYKQGIGTSLLRAFEEFIKEQGYNSYMSSMTVDNVGSQIFHEKLGFKKSGVLHMDHGEEIFYKKDI